MRIPTDIDATNWNQLEPFYSELLERGLSSVAELEALLHDRSELDAAAEEAKSRAYIRMTCFTEDQEASEAFLNIVQEVEPRLKKAHFDLDRKIVDSPLAKELDVERYRILLRELRARVGIYREENLELVAEDEALSQKYNSIIGAMSVELDGETKTLQQAGLAFDGVDRDKRRQAWVACADRRLEDHETLDELFDKLVAARHQIALNAGFANYVEYAFVNRGRFDYTPDDCKALHAAIAELCVPLQLENLRERAEKLQLDVLLPWDLHVDPDGQKPLRPYSESEELVAGTSRVFHRLDPELGALFDTMRDGQSLDLDSRAGKSAGGYQIMLQQSRKPFIFMNAAGTDDDLRTMVHEGGHALHSMLCREDPILMYRDCCAEFCEVASMSMELLAQPYFDEFYDDETAERARRKQLQAITKSLPFIAQIDAFQHWLYTNPEHTHAERDAQWLELDARFRPGVSWDGVADAHCKEWHRVPHLFSYPFYMIEYAIAQLGALQLWTQSTTDEKRALTNYKRALRLGGSKPLPELFEAAQLEFDFSHKTVARLMAAIQARLSD